MDGFDHDFGAEICAGSAPIVDCAAPKRYK
jgi:hypothetical protein